MLACNVCNNDKSRFIFQNKTVCFKCDELLFDMEIEMDEEVKPQESNVKILHISKSNGTTTVKK